MESVTHSEMKETTEVKLPVPAGTLRKWNGAMFLFHAIFGFIALGMGKRDLKVPVYGSKVGIEVLASNATRGWKQVPLKPERVSWLYLTVLVASFSLLSSFFHLGNAFIWRKQYIKALESGYAPFRWMEYSISASVMILLLSYISGSIVMNTQVMLFGLTFVTMIFGHLHEVICRPKSLDEWQGSKLWRLQAHFFGYIPQCFAWGIVIAQFMEGASASTIDASGEERKMPTFVYVIVFGELLVFWSFGIVQLLVSLKPPSLYYKGEIVYMWLSLFAKGLLALLCLSNVILAGGYAEIYADDADTI
uniref:Uncharacterized protein n=1 Tax=Haptolina brevifila TaxID=156173 RepID=A0A7S2JS47_9EUKA|mmetsp:Transcript_9069/g.18425  ORF Transcript_9069/g.18425 Transcript_9069/m.18425 type:complete len:305 (+) Transcript_9069:23-937(+)